MADGYWHFHCPECGFGSAELGTLAGDQELYCEICLDEDRGTVRLQRSQPGGTGLRSLARRLSCLNGRCALRL